MSVVIREAELARDKPMLLRFLAGSNAFESQWESDRRLDTAYPEEFLADRVARARAHRGRVFVAEESAAVVGWAMCSVEQHEIFVKADMRDYGYIHEMYVDERARGRHIGRKLLKACEDHFRALGLKSVLITALSPNVRALNAYRAAGYADYAVNLRKLL